MLPNLPPVALTRIELVETFHRAGFTPVFAETMAAIAMRESAGVPTAHNFNPATKDDSYGLVQIDLMIPQVSALMERNGITKEMLLTADGNAKAAFLLSGGPNVTPAQRLANMRIAWYFDRLNPDGSPSVYKIRYESHLVEIHAAALQSSLA